MDLDTNRALAASCFPLLFSCTIYRENSIARADIVQRTLELTPDGDT